MERNTENRLSRKSAVSMDELISDFIREMKLERGLNTQRVFESWDVVSGAGAYTVNRYFKNGILYCSIASSVVRNRLFFHKDAIVKGMNEFLGKDSLFPGDGHKGPFVKGVVLK